MCRLVLWFLALGAFGVLYASPARADIIDDRARPRPAPTKPPATSPQPEEQPQGRGCGAQREMAPEWIFGFAALGMGAWGLRRQGRRVATPRWPGSAHSS
jgi:hypothetical protein